MHFNLGSFGEIFYVFYQIKYYITKPNFDKLGFNRSYFKLCNRADENKD